jgi:penicillin-insensitive murein DD-endopeptidase
VAAAASRATLVLVRRRATLILLFAAAWLAAPAPAAGDKKKTVWAKAKAPKKAEPQAIGGTSSGCLAGAVALPKKGDGFQVMRPARRRHFGHPELAALIQRIGEAVRKEARDFFLPLGDLSQPRGGPAPDGHASHQTGLDADIWFAVGTRDGKPAPVPMVDHAAGAPTAAFGARQERLLELAASDPRVDRVFVNPVLKRALCQAADRERPWLRKLRPWWGHDEHFHVRLVCPADSPDCVPQSAIAEGDGCDELAAWFDTAAQAEKAEERKAYRKRIASKPALPARCDDVAR